MDTVFLFGLMVENMKVIGKMDFSKVKVFINFLQDNLLRDNGREGEFWINNTNIHDFDYIIG